MDLLVQDASYSMSVVYAPTNTLTIGSIVPPGTAGWLVAGTGDFDRDARTDIILQYPHGTNTEFACWFMKGESSTSGVYLYPATVGGTYKIAGIGDFDNDGNPDLLMQDDTGLAAIWFMEGIKLRGGYLLTSQPSTNFRAVGTGDFNHDGKCDILWQYQDINSATNGAMVAWSMNGNSSEPGPEAKVVLEPLLPDDPKYKVVAAADFDNDGYVDVLFQNLDGGSPGSLERWFMQGSSTNSNWGTVRRALDRPVTISNTFARAPR